MGDGECGERSLVGGNLPCSFGLNHSGPHSWANREGVRLFGGLDADSVNARLVSHPDSPAAQVLAGERALVRKVLTMEVFQRDPVSKKPGPVLATVKGWDEFDAFLAQHGTKLVRSMWMGIKSIQMPAGWDSTVVGMENHYSDGTVEVM